MEMEVVFYIGIALFVLFGPWILLWRVNRRRKSDRLEDQSRWADLTARLYALVRGRAGTERSSESEHACHTEGIRAGE